MSSLENITSPGAIVPELWVTVGILAVLLTGMIFRDNRKAVYTTIVALIAAGGAFIAALSSGNIGFANKLIFSSMAAHDPFTVFFEIIFTMITFMVILISISTREVDRKHRTEYFVLILGMLLGMMFLASATDMIMLYLALELVSLPGYLLTGFTRTDSFGTEASLKYVIYGAFSSGVMLFGMSILYGVTGTTSLYEIGSILSSGNIYPGVIFLSMIFILAGIGYKIAFVPFHFWSPDVYQGAPTPVTAYLSVGSKAAGFAVLLRILQVSFSSAGSDGSIHALVSSNWPLVIAVVSAITMTLGNLAALNQSNLKRLLAYSSIAHAGYMLMGVATVSVAGIKSVLFYLFVYAFMNLGAFYVLITLANRLESYEIDDYKGVGWRAPFMGTIMVVFLISLAGLPPVLGFVGKFYLFAAVIEKGLYWLALIGLLNSVIALYYYARIFKTMWLFKPGEDEEAIASGSLNIALSGFIAAVIVFFPVYWEPLARLVDSSAKMAGF